MHQEHECHFRLEFNLILLHFTCAPAPLSVSSPKIKIVWGKVPLNHVSNSVEKWKWRLIEKRLTKNIVSFFFRIDIDESTFRDNESEPKDLRPLQMCSACNAKEFACVRKNRKWRTRRNALEGYILTCGPFSEIVYPSRKISFWVIEDGGGAKVERYYCR